MCIFDLRLKNKGMIVCTVSLNIHLLNEAPVKYVNVIMFIVRNYKFCFSMNVIFLENEGWIRLITLKILNICAETLIYN